MILKQLQHTTATQIAGITLAPATPSSIVRRITPELATLWLGTQVRNRSVSQAKVTEYAVDGDSTTA
jgi:hypothetical protein